MYVLIFLPLLRTALHSILIVMAALQILILILKQLKIDQFKNFTRCFEYKKSFSSLFDYNTLKDEITCVHGIKVLACLSVILYHTLLWKIVQFIASNNKSLNYFDHARFNQIELLASSVVEPFFVLSAIFLTRSVIKEQKRYNIN